MKKFIYVVIALDDKEIFAIYEDKDIAEKMKPSIEAKVGTKVEIVKHRVNPDIKIIGL